MTQSGHIYSTCNGHCTCAVSREREHFLIPSSRFVGSILTLGHYNEH